MCSGTEQEQVLFSLDKTPVKVAWVFVQMFRGSKSDSNI